MPLFSDISTCFLEPMAKRKGSLVVLLAVVAHVDDLQDVVVGTKLECAHVDLYVFP